MGKAKKGNFYLFAHLQMKGVQKTVIGWNIGVLNDNEADEINSGINSHFYKPISLFDINYKHFIDKNLPEIKVDYEKMEVFHKKLNKVVFCKFIHEIQNLSN